MLVKEAAYPSGIGSELIQGWATRQQSLFDCPQAILQEDVRSARGRILSGGVWAEIQVDAQHQRIAGFQASQLP